MVCFGLGVWQLWGFCICAFPFYLEFAVYQILRKREQDFQATGFVWFFFFPLENIKYNSVAWPVVTGKMPANVFKKTFVLENSADGVVITFLSFSPVDIRVGLSLPVWVLTFDISDLQVVTRQREIPMDHSPLGHPRVLQILGSQTLEWVYEDCPGLKILVDKLDLEITPFVSLLVSVKHVAAFGSNLTIGCISLCLRLSCPEKASICMGRRFGEPKIMDSLPISVSSVLLIGLKEQTHPAPLMAQQLFWLYRPEFSHLGNLLNFALISKTAG